MTRSAVARTSRVAVSIASRRVSASARIWVAVWSAVCWTALRLVAQKASACWRAWSSARSVWSSRSRTAAVLRSACSVAWARTSSRSAVTRSAVARTSRVAVSIASRRVSASARIWVAVWSAVCWTALRLVAQKASACWRAWSSARSVWSSRSRSAAVLRSACSVAWARTSSRACDASASRRPNFSMTASSACRGARSRSTPAVPTFASKSLGAGLPLPLLFFFVFLFCVAFRRLSFCPTGSSARTHRAHPVRLEFISPFLASTLRGSGLIRDCRRLGSTTGRAGDRRYGRYAGT